MSADFVNLNVLVKNTVVCTSLQKTDKVSKMFDTLVDIASKEGLDDIKFLLGHVTKSSCRFHKLDQLVLPEYDDDTGLASEATVNECKDTPKRVMQANYKINRYFSSDPEDEDGVHVVMQLPNKIYMKIKFHVLVHDALVAIDMSNKRDVKDIYEIVSKKAPKRIKSLLGRVEEGDCELHKLEQPILTQRDVKSKGLINATIKQCQTANTELMELNQEVYDYFDSNPEVGRIHVVMQLPAKIYGKIMLNVLIYNALVAIDINNERLVRDIYEEVKVLLPEDVKGMISGLQTSTLIFEQINPPVKCQPGSDGAHMSDETTRECQEAEKKTMMNQMQIADYFVYDSLSRSHIHVIIRPPEDAIDNAINNMKRVDSNLYERLRVERTNPDAWSCADYPSFVAINTVVAHMEFEKELTAPRKYNLENGNRFFKLALSVLGKGMLGKFLFNNAESLPNNFMPDDPVAVSDGPATVSAEELELLIFSTLEPAFVKRIARFKGKNASSHFKQALFLWHFVLHPALAVEEQGRLKFTTENRSQIKYYVVCRNDDGEWTPMGSYRPYSDMAIISSKLGCPFLLCEVDSNQRKKDKHRMLAVATSAARVGQYLLTGTTTLFVLMAIFVTKDFIVERYLVSQIKVDDSKVVITQRNFDLENPEEAYEFLRQMYNFAHHVNEMSQKLDGTKEGLLQKMNEAGKNIRSYESNKKSETRDTGSNVDHNRPLPSIPENQNEETDAPEEMWERSDVCELLKRIGCDTEERFDMVGHPGVISIEKMGKGLVYMKYISHRNIRELEILQYLKKFDPSWTYVLPFQDWNIKDGTIVEFPRGGVHVTDYLKSDTNPIPIALQLVEAVEFLHEHNVAHRDIKSENILVNSSGKLWVIDYSLARQMNGEDEMRKGFVGTPGRVAPEVKKEGGAHSPVRADRWAVGYVIKTICNICKPSPQRKFLERLSSSLMAYDPSSRLTMRRCSELIKQYLSIQQAVNVRAPSKFMDGGNHQPLAVAS